VDVIPIILCGGSGTRLWPLSRSGFAKQHIPLLGGESPFQQTLRRVAALPGVGAPIVVTGAEGRFMVARQAEEVGIKVEMILEPTGRDTLAAITAGSMLAARRSDDAVALVLPSDHLIPDREAFADAVFRARAAAQQGDFVTFGLRARGPSSAYGYIRPGDLALQGARYVAGFIEKPAVEKARDLVEQGCLWNAGIFAFQAEAALAEIGALAPEAYAAVQAAVSEAAMDLGALRLGKSFAEAPKISFDHGIMERTERSLVLEVDFDWSDIGDWREVWALSDKDESEVASEGPVVALDTSNSYIRAEGRLVCTLGVDGIVVVDTPDAVLVAAMDRTQDVKKLVASLADRKRPEAHTPARVHRPWGWYQTMDLGERFRVKRICVSPGKQLSLQKHHHRAEHWVVVRGTAEVTSNGQVSLVRENESIYLPLGTVHRLTNPGRIHVEIIEVQTGSYLEEDDIVRLKDDFGRT
jgi:mannose-1-phosphate guanylyltransferase / mannose-6-phosphate isomerase